MELAQGLLPIASALIYNARHRAEASEKQSAVDRLRAEYPELLTPSENLQSLNCAAKNIRTQLKKAFPGHKFSVRIESFSMGNSITVTWTDGPADSRVDAIIDPYQYGWFDGYDDCYKYSNSPWVDAFGGSMFVKSSRHYSPQLIAWANEQAGGDEMPWRAEIWHVLRALNIKAIKPATVDESGLT